MNVHYAVCLMSLCIIVSFWMMLRFIVGSHTLNKVLTLTLVSPILLLEVVIVMVNFSNCGGIVI